jgi:hypothetical protein
MRTVICLVAICSTGALLQAAPALAGAKPTPMPQRFCGTIRVGGAPWGVDGKGPRCRFMRRSARGFIRDGIRPDGWRCVNLGSGGTCSKRHSSSFFEFYAED